ncbi:MAG: 4-hydroxy-tetrahydrodipicolinate reductase [Deltaproteobacteria bacterium]|nr:4-hydroxy-tetrahydrodipicolinate reductase [Deltaproteobacteria bacterium]
MTGIAVSGVAGRMGKSIVSAVVENKALELTGALESPGHPSVGKDAGLVCGLEKTGVKVADTPERAFRKADVIIDFSTPEASIRNLEVASAMGKAIVIGTTGFSHHHRERMSELSRAARVVAAPNMSIGVNLLFKLVEAASMALGDDYDSEIIEYHHRHKVDAPSGSALRIAEVMAHTLKRDMEKVLVYARKGIIGERANGEIGIQSVRAGDIVGDHVVLFAGNGERVELIHRAHSRSTFARGAVRAALWLVDKPVGLYDMQDVLGLR